MGNFDEAAAFVLGWERARSDDPRDPGGLTVWGIASRAHPDVHVAALTKEGALDLYRARYWGPCGCEDMPRAFALVVFDGAVNQGPERARRWSQIATGVTPADGRIGPASRAAFRKLKGDALRSAVFRMSSLRARAYLEANEATGGAFAGGWGSRFVACVMRATELLKEEG